MARHEIRFKPSALKSLEKIPRPQSNRILMAIEELADDPHPAGSIKLKNEDDLWRIRVGNYRVIYEIEDDQLIILVLVIAHRKDAYRQ